MYAVSKKFKGKDMKGKFVYIIASGMAVFTAFLGGAAYVRATSPSLESTGRIEANGVIFEATDMDVLRSAMEANKVQSYSEGYSEGKAIGTGAKGIGSLSGVSSGTIDCTGIDGWENLTVEDFTYGIERISAGISSSGSTNGASSMPKTSNRRSGTSAVSLSYDQTTGQLTVSGGMLYTDFYEFFTGRVGWYHDNGDAYYDNLYAGCNITTTNKLTVYLKK